jgi:peptidoglycan/LPS O-acetylase OafA/YrhL
VREEGGKEQLPALTSLRFFAAMAVMLHHAAPIGVRSPVMVLFFGQLGWLGVSFFFLLSGFVLMWAYNPLLTPAQFIARRLTRIYPLHLLTLICALLLFGVFHTPIGGYKGTEAGTLASVFLVHDWVPLHPEIRQAWNGVSWSLSCEFFFYVCAPLLLPVLAKRRGWVFAKAAALGWLCLGAVIITAYVRHWDVVLDVCLYHPVPRFFEFALGALGARWLQQGLKPPSSLVALAVMLVPVLGYFLAAGPGKAGADILNLLFIPGAFLLILAVAAEGRAGGAKILRHPWLVALGEASFALYMVHALLLGVLIQAVLTPVMRWYNAHEAVELGTIALYAACAVALSLVVHLWVEAPLRRWLMRRLGGGRLPAQSFLTVK